MAPHERGGGEIQFSTEELENLLGCQSPEQERTATPDWSEEWEEEDGVGNQAEVQPVKEADNVEGSETLSDAPPMGDVEKLTRLLALGCDINEKDVSIKGQLNISKLLPCLLCPLFFLHVPAKVFRFHVFLLLLCLLG